MTSAAAHGAGQTLEVREHAVERADQQPHLIPDQLRQSSLGNVRVLCKRDQASCERTHRSDESSGVMYVLRVPGPQKRARTNESELRRMTCCHPSAELHRRSQRTRSGLQTVAQRGGCDVAQPQKEH
jgi:hypothetical protein